MQKQVHRERGMVPVYKSFFGAAMGIVTLICGLQLAAPALQAQEATRLAYAPIGNATSVPAGYLQFCRDNRGDCDDGAEDARDVVLSKSAWRDLQVVNDRVNAAVEPVTDEDNYGTIEYWSYPANGKGDCEDYVLMKRKLLIDAGWPRSA